MASTMADERAPAGGEGIEGLGLLASRTYWDKLGKAKGPLLWQEIAAAVRDAVRRDDAVYRAARQLVERVDAGGGLVSYVVGVEEIRKALAAAPRAGAEGNDDGG